MNPFAAFAPQQRSGESLSQPSPGTAAAFLNLDAAQGEPAITEVDLAGRLTDVEPNQPGHTSRLREGEDEHMLDVTEDPVPSA